VSLDCTAFSSFLFNFELGMSFSQNITETH
jgi:hypothetical protein